MSIALPQALFRWAAIAAAGLAAGSALAQAPSTGTRSVEGPAGAIYVDDGGGVDGVPVLFLHSFAGDSTHWASEMSHLRHHRRALAMDLRGHGKSARPRDGDYSVAAMAKDVAAAAKALDLERFVLVGHGLGGLVAAEYASRNPKRVAGLVLVGVPLRENPDHWEERLAGAQPHVRSQLLAQAQAMPAEHSTAIMKAMLAYDPLPAIDRYRGPKLVVTSGEGDSPRDLHALRPGIRSERIGGTSDWPHLDQPAEFDRVIDAFLEEVR